jgi:hypothetical protein
MWLPVELQYKVVAQLGADATIDDWRKFEQDCETWSFEFEALLLFWLQSRPAGSKFWGCEGTPDETSFILKHSGGVSVKCKLGRRLTVDGVVLVECSVSVTCFRHWQGVTEWWLSRESVTSVEEGNGCACYVRSAYAIWMENLPCYPYGRASGSELTREAIAVLCSRARV